MFFQKKLQSKNQPNFFATYRIELIFGSVSGRVCPELLRYSDARKKFLALRTILGHRGDPRKKHEKLHVLECDEYDIL